MFERVVDKLVRAVKEWCLGPDSLIPVLWCGFLAGGLFAAAIYTAVGPMDVFDIKGGFQDCLAEKDNDLNNFRRWQAECEDDSRRYQLLINQKVDDCESFFTANYETEFQCVPSLSLVGDVPLCACNTKLVQTAAHDL